MSRELEMLTEVKDFNQDCTYDTYTKGVVKSRCFVGPNSCNKCIWSLGDPVNIHLIEIVDILEVEDVS